MSPNHLCYLLTSSLSIALLIALFPGCSAKQTDPDEAMKFFGMSYMNYQQIWSRPPANWEEILTLAEGEGLEPDLRLLNQARESDFVVVWNQDCLSPKAEERVLAYASATLEAEGKVLFADGSLRLLSSAELDGYLSESNGSGEPADGAGAAEGVSRKDIDE